MVVVATENKKEYIEVCKLINWLKKRCNDLINDNNEYSIYCSVSDVTRTSKQFVLAVESFNIDYCKSIYFVLDKQLVNEIEDIMHHAFSTALDYPCGEHALLLGVDDELVVSSATAVKLLESFANELKEYGKQLLTE